jgi:hypothetical protein
MLAPSPRAVRRQLAIPVAGCSKQKVEGELRSFIEQHEQTLRPLQKDAGLAAWKASITGADADYEDSKTKQLALEKLYTDREAFAHLRVWREGAKVQDPQLRRELEVLYLAYLGNQIPDSLLERLVDVQNDVDKIFSTFRGKVGDATNSDNELRDTSCGRDDSARLQAAWEASTGRRRGAAEAPRGCGCATTRRNPGFPNYQPPDGAAGVDEASSCSLRRAALTRDSLRR